MGSARHLTACAIVLATSIMRVPPAAAAVASSFQLTDASGDDISLEQASLLARGSRARRRRADEPGSGTAGPRAPSQAPADAVTLRFDVDGVGFEYPALKAGADAYTPDATVTTDGASASISDTQRPVTYRSPNHDAVFTVIGK